MKNSLVAEPIDTFPSFEEKYSSLEKGLRARDTRMINFDIIDAKDPVRKIVENIINLKEELSLTGLEGKSLACFIGAGIGDSLGSFLEFNDLNYERNYLKGFHNVNDILKNEPGTVFRSVEGQITDDTSQALCVADSILENNFQFNGKDLRYRILLWWVHGYNNCREETSSGLGQMTLNSFRDFLKNPADLCSGSGIGMDNGNGSVMRLSPVPIGFVNNLEECLYYAEKQSYATHNGFEAAECCRLLSYITWHFLIEPSEKKCREILEDLGKHFTTECVGVQALANSRQESEENMKLYPSKFNQSVRDRNWNWKDPNFKYSELRAMQTPGDIGSYCMDATAMALHMTYHTRDFKEAILKTVNLGGDADSVGAVTGMLAGSLYGYNTDLKNWYVDYMVKWDKMRIAIRAYKLLQRALKRK